MQCCVIITDVIIDWNRLIKHCPKVYKGLYLLICYGVCRSIYKQKIIFRWSFSQLFADKLPRVLKRLKAYSETWFRAEEDMSTEYILVMRDNRKFSYELKLLGFNSVDTLSTSWYPEHYHRHWKQPYCWNLLKFLFCFNYLLVDQFDGFLVN